MSIHHGRMSRTDAYTAFCRIRQIAAEFGPAGAHLIHAAVQAAEFGAPAAHLIHAAVQEQARTDGAPDAATIRALLTDLNCLVVQRLMRSELTAPTTASAITVYLYGTSAGDTDKAAQIAARELQTLPESLRLVDATPHASADTVGTRYTFRTVLENVPASS